MTAPLPRFKRLLLMIALLLSSGVVTARALQPQATSTADSCPSGWSCADIGAPTSVGSQALNRTTWTVAGSGRDIWGTADQVH
jgi:hypothetical protein